MDRVGIIIVLVLLYGAMIVAGENDYDKAVEDPAAAGLARPSRTQYDYHEQERIMFIHLSPAAWQGNEWDDWSTPLEKINPAKLDTDQWCRAAKSWGANAILYVAKHVGGFCWWQTETSPYSIKNTPYKGGKGDVLDELAASCKKHGLKLGIYIYPGDRAEWGTPVGSGGRTNDPSKQEAYNKMFRQQYIEVLSRFKDDRGFINELWFDGSCIIPLSDIIDKYAPYATVLQSPDATIRWCGTESGKLGYPAWNSLSKKDLGTGLSTQAHGDPDGDGWAPLEADVPLLSHHWLWSKEKVKHRKSVNQLLEIYYKSVGRGGILLLNAAPNTDGLIPEGDMERYREFGDELSERFSNPKGTAKGAGKAFTIKFDKPVKVNQFAIMEDYRYGERIRKYVVEAKDVNGNWVVVNKGQSVGYKRIVMFEPIVAVQMSLRITENVGVPLVRSFEAFYVEGDNEFLEFAEDKGLVRSASTGKPARASEYHSEPYLPRYINDGNMSTRWATDIGSDQWWVEIDLKAVTEIDQVSIVEGWGRIRKFRIEYRSSENEEWETAVKGSTVGSNYLEKFEPVEGRYFRLNILKSTEEPSIWEWQLYSTNKTEGWRRCESLKPDEIKQGEGIVDVSKHITTPGQYLLRLDGFGIGNNVEKVSLFYNAAAVMDAMVTKLAPGLYNINHTAATTQEYKVRIKLEFTANTDGRFKPEVFIKRAHE